MKEEPNNSRELENQSETVESAAEIDLEELGEAELRDIAKVYIEQEKTLKEKMLNAEEEAASAKTLADDYKDRWMRLAAEFDNYKKRNAEIRKSCLEEGRTDVIKKILSIGDNLDRALKMSIDEKTKEGLEMLKKQFAETLGGLGVTPVAEKGEDFDPNLHEAVMQAEGDGESSGKISEVFLCGYKLGDKMIRYAQVAVFK